MKLEDRAWQMFARFIKLRDTNQYGYGKCIDTNAPIFYYRRNERWCSNCDSGHYISREIKTIMFNEDNVHAQSIQGNRFNWTFSNYRENLIIKIGLERVVQLEEEKRLYGIGKSYHENNYEEILDIYTKKVELCLKNKMF